MKKNILSAKIISAAFFLIIIFSILVFVSVHYFATRNFTSQQKNNTVSVLKSNKKYAALTFDDGPYGKPTEEILDILKKNNITATFFLVGQNVVKYPDLVRREITEGHILENHTWDHSKTLHTQTTSTITDNLKRTDDVIEKNIGKRPHLFRPPYGYVSPQLNEAVSSTGHVLVMWNVAPRDYLVSCDETCIVSTVLKQTRNHDRVVIDLHDGRDVKINYPRDNIVNALPIIIFELQKQGYEFVTVDQLLGVEAYQL